PSRASRAWIAAVIREWRDWAGGGGGAGGGGASGAWQEDGQPRSAQVPGGIPGFPSAVRQEVSREGGELRVGLFDAGGGRVGGWRMPEGLAGPMLLDDGSRVSMSGGGVEIRSASGVGMEWQDGESGSEWRSLGSDAGAISGDGNGGAGAAESGSGQGDAPADVGAGGGADGGGSDMGDGDSGVDSGSGDSGSGDSDGGTAY
ncbi:MAG: hypothetical protein JNM82_07440, partial [Rhodocyclaceae bacterium]|nr:hypothetical protein [Rhodocyclaceae bacterium]